jgi:hypothetical protein
MQCNVELPAKDVRDMGGVWLSHSDPQELAQEEPEDLLLVLLAILLLRRRYR